MIILRTKKKKIPRVVQIIFAFPIALFLAMLLMMFYATIFLGNKLYHFALFIVMFPRKEKRRVQLWYLGWLPEEVCPICDNDKSFEHGFEDWNRHYYCTECGLFVNDLPEEMRKIVRG